MKCHPLLVWMCSVNSSSNKEAQSCTTEQAESTKIKQKWCTSLLRYATPRAAENLSQAARNEMNNLLLCWLSLGHVAYLGRVRNWRNAWVCRGDGHIRFLIMRPPGFPSLSAQGGLAEGSICMQTGWICIFPTANNNGWVCALPPTFPHPIRQHTGLKPHLLHHSCSSASVLPFFLQWQLTVEMVILASTEISSLIPPPPHPALIKGFFETHQEPYPPE